MRTVQPVNMVRKHNDDHICICRQCGGTGTVDGAMCSQCEGSGRVVVCSDVTTYVRPFVPEEQL